MNNEDKQLDKKEIPNLTEQNFLMLKHIENGKNIREAYKLAGYEGTNYYAPYQLYHRLKKKLELVYEADNIDSLRLKMAAKHIMDLPIEDKPVKAEVRLRAIETLAKLTESKKQDAKAISPFIIFKAPDGQLQATQAQVIEAVDVNKTEDENEE